MKRTKLLQETRKMRFEEAHTGWTENRLTQEEAALLLGVCTRTFRRYINRYEENGLDGLIDKRLDQISHRRAPVDEVMKLVNDYQSDHLGWNAKHFHTWYQRKGGTRSYTFVKKVLQEKEFIKPGKSKGKHRIKRARSPLPGMMIHQDGSTHEWVPGQVWDLIVTMDDANNEHYSMFFVEQEGTVSSFRGVFDTLMKKGLFCSFYSDRGSHYWLTPEAGSKVDKVNLTQFGRAMKQLGIGMIAAYSPQARGRSERMFSTHQERLPKELALAGITDITQANKYLEEIYLPQFNQEFIKPAREEGSAFTPLLGAKIKDILCEQHERVVGQDNCVQFEGLKLQIESSRHRINYVKLKVKVHRFWDGQLSIFYGPKKLGDYDQKGLLIKQDKEEELKAAA